MSNLSKTAKALILTWILIGLLVAGGTGFYLGRITASKIPAQPSGMQTQDGLREGQQPNSGQQPLPSGLQQKPQGSDRSGPVPSGQQNVQQIHQLTQGSLYNKNESRINSKQSNFVTS